jgi:hypothetical protein
MFENQGAQGVLKEAPLAMRYGATKLLILAILYVLDMVTAIYVSYIA